MNPETNTLPKQHTSSLQGEVVDLPPELPAGRAKVELTITPEPVLQETGGRGKIRLTKEMVDEMMQDETLRSLTGILHTEMSIEEIRNERLSNATVTPEQFIQTITET